MKPTKGEEELLRLVLREVRHAKATGEQLQIVVDPHVHGDGANVGFLYNSRGWSAELAGLRKRRSSRPRSRR